MQNVQRNLTDSDNVFNFLSYSRIFFVLGLLVCKLYGRVGSGEHYGNSFSITACCFYKSQKFSFWILPSSYLGRQCHCHCHCLWTVLAALSVHVWLQRVTMKKEESKVSPKFLILTDLSELCLINLITRSCLRR